MTVLSRELIPIYIFNQLLWLFTREQIIKEDQHGNKETRWEAMVVVQVRNAEYLEEDGSCRHEEN